MLKYLQEATDELNALRTGISDNASLWAAMPITIAQIDAATTAIKNKSDQIDAAETALQQRRAEGRKLAEQYNPLISQATNLATGLHTADPEKLSSYGISQPKAATTVPPPGKAIILSVKDDSDGIGFIVTVQPLNNADTFEIEKAVAATADTAAAPGPFAYYKSSRKLSLVDDDVEQGRRYYYRVRAMNRNGYGEWSEPVGAIQ